MQICWGLLRYARANLLGFIEIFTCRFVGFIEICTCKLVVSRAGREGELRRGEKEN